MKLAVLNKNGEKVKDLAKPTVFDVKVSDRALTLYINYLRSTLRAPIANTKDRSEVSGGGRKPWKQKGTGSARTGSTRSPLWVGGGVTFGPSNIQNFRLRLNKTERKNAILGIFSRLIDADKLVVVDDLSFSEPKTSEASLVLDQIKASGKISLISGKEEKNSILSFRNIAGVCAMQVGRINPIYILTSDMVVMSLTALKELESQYSDQKQVEAVKESNE